MTNLKGKTLGKYQIIERLGRGGMAEVYKAYHPQLDRHVAIKILHGYLAEGEDFIARFEREAKAVAALRHPKIVQIYDFQVDDDMCYMVMEFVEGETLKDKLMDLARSGNYMSFDEVSSIISQVTEGLEYAHQQGIIHRDIKPSNILLDNSGNVFLTDFGLARIVSSTQFTATGALVGTPSYMSPEQGRGLELTRTSDIYSLGIILFELLTGKVPFDSETPLAVIHMQINNPLPAPISLRPDLPEVLERVITKALAKNPEERYQSAAETSEALDKAMLLISEGAIAPSIKEQQKPDTFDRPTVVLEDEVTPDASDIATMVMEDKLPLKKSAPAKVKKKDIPSPAAKKARPKKKKTTTPRRIKERAKAKPSYKKKPQVVVMAIIGIVVVAIILFIAFSGAVCSSIEECYNEALGLTERGDLEGAVKYYEKALELVPDNEHPHYAYIWCELSGINRELGRVDTANENIEMCEAWSREGP